MFAIDIPDTMLDAYWATTAQILAVLALAMVVEARALQRQWKNLPIWFQLLQSLIWFLFLAAMAVLVPSAVEASRPDRSQPDWMPWVAENVITWSASVLVLSPALVVLVTGSAGFFYTAKGVFSPLRWKIWRDKHRVQKILRRHNAQVSDMQHMLDQTIKVQKETEADREKSLKIIKKYLSFRKNADMNSEDVEDVMNFIEWHVIRAFDASCFYEKAKRAQSEIQESLRESFDLDGQFLELTQDENKNEEKVRNTLKEIAKIKTELLRNNFESANSEPTNPPKP